MTQGVLTFEGDATFARNEASTLDSTDVGRAGAISNAPSGSILFKGKLTMEENEADVRSEEIIWGGRCKYYTKLAIAGRYKVAYVHSF